MRRLRDGSLLGTLGRDIAYLTSGAVLAQIVLVVGQIITARLYTPSEFGAFAIALAWANIIAVVATLRYEMAIPLADTEDEARAVTRLCLVASTTVAVVLVIGLGAASAAGHVPFGIASAWWSVPLILWGTAVFAAVKMQAGRAGEFGRVGTAGVVASVGQVGTQVGFGLLGFAPGLAAGQGVGRVLNAAWIGTSGSLRSDVSMGTAARRWKRMPALNTLPALLNVISVGAVAPLVERWFGLAFAGHFGFATRLLAAPAVLLGQAVSQVLFPTLAKLDRTSGDAAGQVRRATLALVLVALPVFSVVWLLGPEAFALVFGERWREAGLLAAVMAPWLAANFVSSPLASYATVKNKLGRILVISLIEAGTRVAGLYLGVLTGSALVGVIAYSVAGVGICVAFTGWVLSLAGVDRRGVVRDLSLPLALAVLVAAVSVAVRLTAPPVWTLVVGIVGVAVLSVVCGRRLWALLPRRSR
ncbi:MAG: oligosaccharide flippase family protein [Mobilicoccus sp.]|nr:oligosaccharide flippase family protein [Mobilicoccus sp.]